MESAAPGVVSPGVGVPDRSVPGGSPEVAVASQLAPCCPVSPLCDDPALDGGQPKSFWEADPAALLVPLPRLKLPDALFAVLDPPNPEDVLLELPNPDDPLCPEPNPLLDPFWGFVPVIPFWPFWPFWPNGEAPGAGP